MVKKGGGGGGAGGTPRRQGKVCLQNLRLRLCVCVVVFLSSLPPAISVAGFVIRGTAKTCCSLSEGNKALRRLKIEGMVSLSYKERIYLLFPSFTFWKVCVVPSGAIGCALSIASTSGTDKPQVASYARSSCTSALTSTMTWSTLEY
jgi:hypothetical protein